jgi:GNAT superfamily N-acetyltransferase
MSLMISVVEPDRRELALRLLFSRFPAEEQPARMHETLRAVERGTLNLDGLLLAEEGELPVGAALMMPQADGVALVWPPVISCQSRNVETTEQALMKRLCEQLDLSGSKLAQCLLAPDDAIETALLQKHNFHHAADMFFLARTLSDADRERISIDDDLDHECFSESKSDFFARVIEQTYTDSLDCPFLNDFRSGSDAIKSHQLSGQFDPAGWRLYRHGSDVIGLLLLNEHPEQDAIELVYFGIIPEFRGRGLGRKVLHDGILAAALTGRSVVFLAVDCGNTYANALYNEMGFAELARRRIMLRRFPQLARK